MIVLDASAVLALLLNLPPASGIRSRLEGPGETMHAHHLLDVEVLQVLRRHADAGRISKARADAAIAELTT